jgi:hypothetical protein
VPATRVAAGEIKEARCEMTADGLLSHLHIWGGGEVMRIYPRGARSVCVPILSYLRRAIKFPGPFEGINFYLNKSNQRRPRVASCAQPHRAAD